MTSAADRQLAAYRRAMARSGESLALRRGTGSAAESINVRARVTGFAPEELVGDLRQGDRKIIVMAEDVTLLPPVRPGDRVLLRGQPLNITAVDDSTRRVAGVLIAYVLTARGQ